MGLRLRHYKPCDAECIVSWIKDEDALRKWSSDRFGDYPITSEDINNKYIGNNGDCIESDNFYPLTAFDEAFAVYLIVDIILLLAYVVIWIVCFWKNNVFRALALLIIPSVLFLFSDIMSRSVLLIVSALLFAPTHILISYKNAD